MRKRIESVDFGPISLDIADKGASAMDWGEPSGEASLTDVLKLKRLIGISGVAESIHDNPPLVREDIVDEVAASVGQPSKFGAEVSRIIKLAVAITHSSSSIATSIKLRLAQDLLPDTELSVEKHALGFNFDLYISDSAVLGDLQPIAENLTKELSQYLDVSIRLRLFSQSEATPEVSAFWHRGQY
jgi:hypothetical protein